MKTHVLPSYQTGIMFGLLMILSCILFWSPVRADIYFWTDSGGIIHFSNHNPPPEAELLMVEQPPTEKPLSDTKPTATLPKRNRLHDQLDEANRKLEKALEKVDDLAEKVEQTRREARSAADAAQQAQAEAKIAGENRSERTVVYGVPYKSKRRRPHPEPYYWRHDTSKYPYYQQGRHRPSHRPGGKPGNLRPRTSGISVGFSRNGTQIKGHTQRSAGVHSGRHR